jgi:hypothetical protein
MLLPLAQSPLAPEQIARRYDSSIVVRRWGATWIDFLLLIFLLVRGRRYRTIKDVPKECVAFRADVSSTVQWRALYRAVDPTHKVTRPR